jgi:hypothetical protein
VEPPVERIARCAKQDGSDHAVSNAHRSFCVSEVRWRWVVHGRPLHNDDLQGWC